MSGLIPESSLMSGASKTLSSKFVEYLIQEKAQDPDASLPQASNANGTYLQPWGLELVLLGVFKIRLRKISIAIGVRLGGI